MLVTIRHKVASYINSFFKHQVITILLGKHALFIATHDKRKLVQRITIDNTDPEYTKKYQDFLANYQKWQLFILLDNNETQLSHESLPIVKTLLNSNNAVNHFRDLKFAKTDLVAYNTYELLQEDPEIWQTMFARTAFSEELKQFINYILTNDFFYSGIYFLDLEITNILAEVMTPTNTLSPKKINIFIINTRASGFRTFVVHNGNILLSKTTTPPPDATVAYLQGIVEQEISDAETKFHNYTHDKNLALHVTILTSLKMRELLKQNNPNPNWEVIALFDLGYADADNGFSDRFLTNSFVRNKKFMAINESLAAITHLEFITNIVFKPIITLLLVTTLILGIQGLKILKANNELEFINNNYITKSAEYQDLRKKFNEVANYTIISDILSDLEILQQTPILPFATINSLNAINDSAAIINTLNWELAPTSAYKKQSKLEVIINYSKMQTPKDILVKDLQQYLININKNMRGYNFEAIIHHDNALYLPKRTEIPVKIVLTGPK